MTTRKVDKPLKEIYDYLGISRQIIHTWKKNPLIIGSRNHLKYETIKRAGILFSLSCYETEKLANKAGLSLLNSYELQSSTTKYGLYCYCGKLCNQGIESIRAGPSNFNNLFCKNFLDKHNNIKPKGLNNGFPKDSSGEHFKSLLYESSCELSPNITKIVQNITDYDDKNKYSDAVINLDKEKYISKPSGKSKDKQSKKLAYTDNIYFANHFNTLLSAYPGKKIDLCWAASVSERMFRHLKSGRYLRKESILALLIVMNLSLEDIQEALKKAGFILSYSLPNDVVVIWLLENESKNNLYYKDGADRLNYINETLDSLGLPLIMLRQGW